jgi:hypothetical protein
VRVSFSAYFEAVERSKPTDSELDGNVAFDSSRVRAHVVSTFYEFLDLRVGKSDFLKGFLVDLLSASRVWSAGI